ncbi:MAG: c-type cytochrome [Bryobacterales bacterium]|nr:c-type cytochrome [Bryobacterales bacterium]
MERLARRSVLLVVLGLASWPVQAASAEEGAAWMQRQSCGECHDVATMRPGILTKLLRTRYTPASLTGVIWNHGATLLSRTSMPGPDRAAADSVLAYFARAGYFETAGDPKQGARVFRLQNCAECHQEKDRAPAPAVSRWPALLSPASLFLAMWRHAPMMRAALDDNKMMWPSLSTMEIRDLLAYARTNNNTPAGPPPDFRLGDAEKGRALLNSRACVTCHRGVRTMDGRPAGQSFTALAGILWNHAPMMMSLPPSLNSAEMADLLAYLWQSRYFDEPGDVAGGRTLFEVRRCAACHDGFPAASDYDATAMLAAFWKHQGAVLEKARSLGIVWPKFSGREMANLISYANSVRRRPLVK